MRSTIVVFLLLFACACCGTVYGQSSRRKKEPAQLPQPTAAPAPQLVAKDELYQQVAKLDADMFAAFNAKDVDKLMSYFAANLEFYHDKGGLSNFSQTKEGFARMFAKTLDITRMLVPGSLEVYPIKDYGAMHIGIHRFCHVENGRDDCGNFKFVMLWQRQGDAWKITRVVSYGH
ncbi:nuclear transport factor 2 family protein [Hymenobacter sp. BT770]|uniref:nuclear transport factor 2 family protein n=1 Tax=Hymenobacter sp. BT770 TaxID=2886942 RepID=UPI001D112533|nr:nuclear transport factor 2 family protein [Hymenobacter sp. BT770]MCC3154925.1 nuclear transport factor 2 family protein [Hymenobacter sp. BT770]MDO3417325.1 nuclear transport factor 2 family protein [Hymenobacter sp. BT770]